MLNNLIFYFASSIFCPYSLRTKLYRYLGMRIGEGTIIRPHLQITDLNKLSNISMGNNCFINISCLFDNSAEIVIGDNVAIAPGVYLLTTTHSLELGDEIKRVRGPAKWLPIEIRQGCWIGARSVVLPGSVVGVGVVVGASSLVLENSKLSPHSLYVGAPCRFVRKL